MRVLKKFDPIDLKLMEQQIEPNDIFGFTYEDLIATSKDAEACLYNELTGENIHHLMINLKAFLAIISSTYKDELTVESMCFQLKTSSDLLFVDYQLIRSELLNISKKNNIWFTHHGVALNDELSSRLTISVFYFQGSIDITSEVTVQPDQWKDFLKQVEYVNKYLK
jgi:hypothetical protein